MAAEIDQHVAAVRLTSEPAKRTYLQAVLGPASDDPGELQFRALLVTALQKAGAWPPRFTHDSAFDDGG